MANSSRQEITATPQPVHASWRFYLKSHEAWEAMYRDCAQATTSIELEQYILENDSLGRRFLELFIRKAKEGVRVFVICDKFGSFRLHRSPLIRKLRSHGGFFSFYNPITLWDLFLPWRWFPRTHTKTLLIDSKIAYAGGVCMAERMHGWRDTQLRIEGPVTAEVRRAFDDIKRRRFARRLQKREWTAPPIAANAAFRYLLNQPRLARHSVYEALIDAVSRAEHYIYITTAFFIPNERFLRLLDAACRRGVQVMVMVPERSDVQLADWVSLSYLGRLLSMGVRVFIYQEGILHSKTAVIDDCWATVGSTNFDVISFFHNREANIVVTDPAAIADLKAHFLRDMHYSRELTWEGWRKIALWKKLTGIFARIFKVFF
jgi:cardiolipin synthase A/B